MQKAPPKNIVDESAVAPSPKKSLTPAADRRYRGFALVLIAPALFFYTVFLIVPMLSTIIISFTEWSGLNFATIKFNGLDNFAQMVNDQFFWTALGNTFLFVIFVLTIEFALALLTAVLLDSNLRFAELFRGIFFVPSVLSLTVIGLLFGFILDPTIGILDLFLKSIGVPSPAFGWLGTPTVNLFVVIGVHIWQHFGFSMFLITAGLQSVPRELLEAARLDGASPWILTTRVTLPLITDVLIIVAVLSTISAMRVFDLVYVMTRGGPYHTSETVITYVYNLGLGGGRTRQGYATAISLVVMLLIMGISLLQLWLVRRFRRS